VFHRASQPAPSPTPEAAAGWPRTRRATTAGLAPSKRIKADACATYLTNKANYLDYPTALAQGWPIASGVIEGTCRYLVADRMDITGARWSVEGAEAISSYEPCAPTTISTSTGSTTSTRNDTDTTPPATPTRPYRQLPDDVPLREPHPYHLRPGGRA
jgi:hypothetical protein